MTVTEQRGINPKALGLTVGIHALILLLCILLKYSTPPEAPPMEELGMEVNLGTSDEGFGTEQPEEPGDPAPDAPSVASLAGGATTEELDPLTADDADAPEIPPTTARNRRTEPAQATPGNRPTTAQQPSNSRPTATQRPRYVYPGSSGPGGNAGQATTAGGSEGITRGSGDQGEIGGTPGAPNYEGSPGRGTGGVGHTLSGRRIIAPPMEASFREGGKVVVRVTVNRAGGIVSKSIVSAPSAELRRVALEKMSQVRFNASPEAPEEQFGTITFVFKTRS